MPLHKLYKTNNNGMVALWYIVENESQLSWMNGEAACPNEITHPEKRKEWLASRILIKELTRQHGINYKGIKKDEYGKPFLVDSAHFISISHSFPYAAAQIQPSYPVGIDIEQPKEQLIRVTPRMLNSDEAKHAGKDLIKHCLYWCAKEALYKVYGKKGVVFKDHLAINAFRIAHKGMLIGHIRLDDLREVIHLRYSVDQAFVLVHSE